MSYDKFFERFIDYRTEKNFEFFYPIESTSLKNLSYNQCNTRALHYVIYVSCWKVPNNFKVISHLTHVCISLNFKLKFLTLFYTSSSITSMCYSTYLVKWILQFSYLHKFLSTISSKKQSDCMRRIYFLFSM